MLAGAALEPKHHCLIVRLCSSFISLDMFLAKAENVEGNKRSSTVFSLMKQGKVPMQQTVQDQVYI